MHQSNILHRDIKPANCFLSEDGSVKLGDLNVSKRLKGAKAQTQIGTPYYMSPEIFSGRPYGPASDIWSLGFHFINLFFLMIFLMIFVKKGCLIYELCALRPPFTGNSLNALKRSVLSGRYAPLPRSYSREMGTFVGGMLALNPRDRASASGLLQSSEVARRSCQDTMTSFSRDNQSVDLIRTIKVF